MFWDSRSGTPFYVGKGCGRRAYCGERSSEVAERIAAIKASGFRHVIEVAPVPTEADAFWFEIDLIASLGRIDMGTGPLLNHSSGGDGFSGKQSDAGRQAISKAMLGNKRRLNKDFTASEIERISNGVKKTLTPEKLAQLKLAGLKGSQRSAELGLNKLGGTHSGAFKKGHTPHNLRGG